VWTTYGLDENDHGVLAKSSTDNTTMVRLAAADIEALSGKCFNLRTEKDHARLQSSSRSYARILMEADAREVRRGVFTTTSAANDHAAIELSRDSKCWQRRRIEDAAIAASSC